MAKDELMRRLWPDTIVEENNLTVNMSALRKALGDDSSQPLYIETLPRRGYRFIAEVQEVSDGLANPEADAGEVGVSIASLPIEIEASANQTARPNIQEAPPEPVAGWKTATRLWIGLAVALLIALSLMLYILVIRSANPAPPINSVVVLPLENLSGDSSQEYFADGMTDALIAELAKINALRVISRTSAMYYKGVKKQLPEIASELNVDAVVEGTVARFGERVQVRVQLIRAENDQHLWAETYNYDLRDVLTMQSAMARAIAREVQIKLTPDEQTRLTTIQAVDRKAYDDYLRGIYHWNRRTEEHLLKAIDYFNSAIRKDETYAPAYAGLADSYAVLAANSFQDPRRCYPEAKRFVARALELDETLAEAHTVQATVRTHYEGDRAGGEQEHKRAIELNAGNSTAHMRYAYFLSQEGRIDESLAESQRALELDPVSLIVNTNLGQRLYNARQFDEAIEQLSKTLELDPNFYIARLELGQAYAQAGRYSDSLIELKKAVELSRENTLATLGYVYAISGRKSEARQVLAELRELERQHYVSSVDLAGVSAGLGDKDQAFAWLDKAYEAYEAKLALLKVDPKFDSLRTDPRFDRLLRQIGLTP
jgi:TolB-like protein/Tfp pilus assembly protein PilF